MASTWRSLRVAWILVIAIGVWMVSATPVLAQEAYYWSYARHLDWSYFDHPPMVAWGIAIGTELAGDSAFGIRLATLAWALGTTLFGQLLLLRFGASRTACSRWVVLSLGMPFLAMGHVIANPDPPLMFFWTACVYLLWRARDEGGWWWIAAGLAAGGALLSKYTSIFLGVGGVVVLLLDPVMRASCRRPGPWVALAVAAVCFLPVVVWNAQNEWASFLFQSADRFHNGGVDGWNLVKFAGEQMGMFSPVIVILVPATLAWLWRLYRAGDRPALWLLAFGLPLAVYMTCSSLYIKPKPNWVMPALVPFAIAVVLWAERTRFDARRPRLAKAMAVGVLVTIVLVAGSPALRFVRAGKGTSWVGWSELSARAESWQASLDRDNGAVGTFLFAPDYRDASQLAYHASRGLHAGVPHQVLAQNVFGDPALCYDYWSHPCGHLGEDAVLVLIRPEARTRQIEQALRHFDRVEKLESVQVRRMGHVVLRASIFACYGYRGPC